MMNRKLGSLNILEGAIFFLALMLIFTVVAGLIEMGRARRSARMEGGYQRPSGDTTNGTNGTTDPNANGQVTDGNMDPSAQGGY